MEFTVSVGSDTTIILMADSTFRIKVTPEKAKTEITVRTDATYYKTPTDKVITISDDGEIKAIDEGKVSVTISNNTRILTFNVVVVKLPSKIPIYYNSLTIKTGKSTRLGTGAYSQYETACFGDVAWEALDPAVATVTQFGIVTAIKEGSARIKVSFRKYPDISSECSIQVLDHIVYLAGQALDENSYVYPASWRNNSEPSFYSNKYSINSIDCNNENLYLAGLAIVIQSDDINRGFIIKNNSEPVIFPEKGAVATAVTHLGSDIYTCGFYSDNGLRTVAVWKNSLLTPISDTSVLKTESRGKCLTASGGNIYVGGYYVNSQGKQVACYWKNKERTDLSDGSVNSLVNSIFVDGQDVYAAGYYVNSSYDNIACYWKNGMRHDLHISDSEAHSIAVSNNIVYVAGTSGDFNTSMACCWRNGLKSDLPAGLGAIKGNAVSITIVDGVEYIGGFYYLSFNPFRTIGCYWKNEVRYDIPATRLNSVNGIEYPYSYVNCMTID